MAKSRKTHENFQKKKRKTHEMSDPSESQPPPPSSPPQKPKDRVVVIDLCNSPTPRREFEPLSGTPLRPIFCVKNREGMKEIENREDCFILEFDPDGDAQSFSSPVVCNKILDNWTDGDVSVSPEVTVLAEKGQVACRDYPHSRHMCLKYPFTTTSHESYCKLCYCFVCDLAAPCANWIVGSGHCHAIDNEAWKSARKLCKKKRISA